jgi:hypothetical protein
MRIFKLPLLAICAIILPFALPAPSSAQLYVGFSAPPPMPEYQQPPVSNPNYQWMPGYWGQGQNGYYWVPGTWMAAPQVGLLWTPGYWGYQQQQNNYAWNQGYWGQNVGYYGGINYGAGYYGNGYVGGGWYGNAFRYNNAVTSVNPRYVTNVYNNKTVIVHNVNRYGYNGPGGVRMHPDAQQLAWSRERHYGLTSMQRTHIAEAQQDRNLYAKVNHGKPAAVAVARPLSSTNRPADFKPLASVNGTGKSASEAANKPAPKSAPKPESKTAMKTAPKSESQSQLESHAKPAAPPQHEMKPAVAQPKEKAGPATKPAAQKAPQAKATHAPADGIFPWEIRR